ncbi:MAG: bifunctional phosphoribosyl-AMP cyclohydrolase/phosphoribosyl-ATP diphosphatase HisIE [Pyrinomonadaceae bacterium]
MNPDFAKYSDGLIPAIVQDANTRRVLMLGFMDPHAIEVTLRTGRVTFYSRKKQRLWTKGETSGNFLELISIVEDCDSDTVLIKARPSGPTCHQGSDTCFGEPNDPPDRFLSELERIIDDRRSHPKDASYISKLFAEGLNRIAQKVGEEAVETVIAAKDDDLGKFKKEAADLLFHYLVLLNAKNINLKDVVEVLSSRHGK